MLYEKRLITVNYEWFYLQLITAEKKAGKEHFSLSLFFFKKKKFSDIIKDIIIFFNTYFIAY